MTTLALPQLSTFTVPIPGTGFKAFARKEGKGGTIAGLKIFRSGTFKDSMGYQRTWEAEHLEQMLFHFSLLRNRNIFPNVPVRDGHPGIFGSGGSVIGYIENLRREKEDETDFLVSDLDITEPDAFDKWERGTFRARSLEVGMYETNDETAYWPVVMGLAFVDIPAVEGLYNKQQNGRPEKSQFHFSQVLMDQTIKETPVAGEQTNPPTPPAAATPPAAPPAGGTVTPPAPVTPPVAAATPPAGTDGGEVTPPVTPPVPAGAHAQAPAPFTFTIAGRQTSNPAEVQAHIASLETFASDTRDEARKNFVTQLATDNKIVATQVADLQAHALTLSDDQWKSFTAIYDAAPANPLFAKHGQTDGGTPPAPGGQQTAADQIEVLEETIAHHRRAGKSEEQIAKMPSFKKLVALKATQSA